MILITGVAGFIGYHVADRILKHYKKVIGIDNLNNYYDTNLKKDRLQNLKKKYKKKFQFIKLDIKNRKKIDNLFKKYKIQIVIHLAAQAGVRYSIYKPSVYLESNINGFYNVIEAAKNHKIKHFIFASSSSVYGDQKIYPIKETDDTSKPLSFYAATKKTNEILSHSYSKIYKLNVTCLRLFTVYGPYGRPDMAPYKFTKSAFEKKNISIFNKGKHERDFTYVTDVSNAVYRLINKRPKNYFQTINVCSSKTIKLMEFIKLVEKITKKKIIKRYLKKQKGDVVKTYGQNNKLKKITGINKFVSIKDGMQKFVNWYVKYNV